MARLSRRSMAFIIAAASAASLVTTGAYFITGYHDLWTCALCRQNRTDYVYLGITWKSVRRDTSCSRWYRQNVEVSHEHIWIHARSSAIRNVFGQRFGAIDRDPDGRMIWKLSPDDQIAIYQHLPNVADGKEIFRRLAKPDEHVSNDDLRTFEQLDKWKCLGYRGRWSDHVERDL